MNMHHSVCVWSKVCGHPRIDHSFPKPRPLIWSYSPFAAITASVLLTRLSTRFWNTTLEICTHHATRASVRLRHGGLVHSCHSSSYQRCLVGLMSGLCAGLSNSSTSISAKHEPFTQWKQIPTAICVRIDAHFSWAYVGWALLSSLTWSLQNSDMVCSPDRAAAVVLMDFNEGSVIRLYLLYLSGSTVLMC